METDYKKIAAKIYPRVGRTQDEIEAVLRSVAEASAQAAAVAMREKCAVVGEMYGVGRPAIGKEIRAIPLPAGNSLARLVNQSRIEDAEWFIDRLEQENMHPTDLGDARQRLTQLKAEGERLKGEKCTT